MKNKRTNKGITLIALIITIIVMLILVAVTINMAINGGLFKFAGKATGDTKNALEKEKELANGRIQVGGVWYDSIDDYINDKPSPKVKIDISIKGTKSNTVPIPAGFKYKEGSIDTGYVIINETDGNEFVWVPVDKDQKISLNITSEKDIMDLILADPCGDEILRLEDNDIETTYSNTNIEPTINGTYVVIIRTEDGIERKKLVVRSLYAIDTFKDIITIEEYAKDSGFESKEEFYLAIFSQELGVSSIEQVLVMMDFSTIEELDMLMETELMGLNQELKSYHDLEDYRESVNKNGGFFIGRYEAGTETRAKLDGNDEIDSIINKYGIPVSKEGYIPYACITVDQALGLAKSMYNSSEFTVSLVTGSGWDRTLGWIYETGAKSLEEITLNSSKWGNYRDANFKVTKGKYLEEGNTSYIEVPNTGYTKENGKSVLLTTGATTRNSANNIFDMAGNSAEYASEKGGDRKILRGASAEWGEQPASNRVKSGEYDFERGFRAAIYLK